MDYKDIKTPETEKMFARFRQELEEEKDWPTGKNWGRTEDREDDLGYMARKMARQTGQPWEKLYLVLGLHYVKIRREIA